MKRFSNVKDMATDLADDQAIVRIMEESERRAEQKIIDAGVHECDWELIGDFSQVTSGEETLDPPIEVSDFYMCKICEQVKNYYTNNGFSVMLHDTDAVFGKPEYTGELIISW